MNLLENKVFAEEGEWITVNGEHVLIGSDKANAMGIKGKGISDGKIDTEKTGSVLGGEKLSESFNKSGLWTKQEIKEAKQFIKDNNLSKDEADLIFQQTKGGYKYLNSNLRNGTDDKDILYTRDKLNSSLDKVSNYKGTVYREIHIDESDMTKFSEKYKIGETIKYDAFVSASKEGASKTSQQISNVRMTIKSKTGKSIEKISNFREEKEVLFKSGSKFKVKGYKYNKPDYWYPEGSIEIDLEEKSH